MTNQSKANIVYLMLASGLAIRLWFLNNNFLRRWFQTRLEISTPLTSWNRVLEGIYLKKQTGETYAGDLVHELPMMLTLYDYLNQVVRPENICYLFFLLDIFNGVILFRIAKKLIDYLIDLECINRQTGKYKRLFESKTISQNEIEEFLLSKTSFDPEFWSLFALGAYLFNPFSISNCVACSTSVIHNLILLAFLYFLLNNQIVVSFFFLAMHSNINVYSISLFTAAICFLFQKYNYIDTNGKEVYKTYNEISLFVVKYFVVFLLMISLIFCFNLFLEDFNLRFIECTYLFILKVPDLVPNLGLFWYFFTEMFDHFRTFFTYVFQMNAFIYAIPLTIRLRNDPIINLILQIGFLSVLKSYPNVGETGFYLAFLPVTAYLFQLMRNFLVYSCMLVFSTILAPVMLYLWLGSGGGNANFYFAITIVYSVGQMFLLADILYAHLKREFIKSNSADVPKSKKNSLAILALD